MPVYNYVSIKEVLASADRKFKLNGSDWLIHAIESIGEGLLDMNTYPQYVDMQKTLCVKGYKTTLPKNLYIIDSVEYEGFPLNRLHTNDRMTFTKKFNKKTYHSQESYELNGGYIYTSFDEGEIILYYKGIKLDCDDFPMVPDIYEVKTALEWKILMDYLSAGNKHPVFKFTDAELRYEDFVGRAKNQMKMPDLDEMELIKSNWLSICPDIEKSYNNFNNISNI